MNKTLNSQDTPYLTLKGELCNVFVRIWENWLHHIIFCLSATTPSNISIKFVPKFKHFSEPKFVINVFPTKFPSCFPGANDLTIFSCLHDMYKSHDSLNDIKKIPKKFNPLTPVNAWMHNKSLVDIEAADSLVQNTRPSAFTTLTHCSHQFHEKCSYGGIYLEI